MGWVVLAKERPTMNGTYQIYLSDGRQKTAEWVGKWQNFFVWKADRDLITHWMPLPPPPEDKGPNV